MHNNWVIGMATDLPQWKRNTSKFTPTPQLLPTPPPPYPSPPKEKKTKPQQNKLRPTSQQEACEKLMNHTEYCVRSFSMFCFIWL